jgi:hypothetical protein
MMSFKPVAIVSSVVALVLGVGYLFAGTLAVGRWRIEPTESVLLLGRRMGALYLGLSIIFFLARSAPRSVARTAVCVGTSAALALLGFLGIYELSAGRVGAGIVPSIAIELLLALSYVWVLVTERRVVADS